MTDSEVMEWASKHPDVVMSAYLSWWAISGPGCRENYFNFVGIARGLAERNDSSVAAKD